MLIKNYKKYINLSRILNSTFGTSPNHGGLTSQSLSFNLLDDGMIKARFIVIVNFGSDSMMREMMRRYRSEAETMLEAGLKRIADDYKLRFPDDEQVKLSVVSGTETDDVEFLAYSVYGSPRKAYFRYNCLVKAE